MTYAQVLGHWGRPLDWETCEGGIWFNYGRQQGVRFKAGRVISLQGNTAVRRDGKLLHQIGDSQASMRHVWGPASFRRDSSFVQVRDTSYLVADFDEKLCVRRFCLTAPGAFDPEDSFYNTLQLVFVDGQALGRPLRHGPRAGSTIATSGDVVAVRGTCASLLGPLGPDSSDDHQIVVGSRWTPDMVGGSWRWQTLRDGTYRCEPHGLTVSTRHGVVESLQLELEDADLLAALNG